MERGKYTSILLLEIKNLSTKHHPPFTDEISTTVFCRETILKRSHLIWNNVIYYKVDAPLELSETRLWWILRISICQILNKFSKLFRCQFSFRSI